MPTYVYECKKCEKVFETEQRMSEDPLKDCECGGKGTLKRLIQPTAVMFKGSGFYVNDSQAKSGTETKSEDPAESGTPKEPCGSDCACSPTDDD